MRDSIWTHFEKLGHISGYQQKRAKCQHCNFQINDALRPARAHFKKCKHITLQQQKNYFGNNLPGNTLQPTNILSTNFDITPSTTPNLQKNIQSFVDRISHSEQQSLELYFAKAIFQCGLYLSLSELKPIQDLWKQARPAFKLPNRKELSTTLLDKVYNETKIEMQFLMDQSENLCLISDGWYVFLYIFCILYFIIIFIVFLGQI